MALSIGTGWSPKSLQGLVAWYDATSGVYSDAGTTLATNGQTVQQWNDLSGHGYHLSQATSTNRPVYSSSGLSTKPSISVVNSGGISKYMLTSASAVSIKSPTVSVFAVVTLRSTQNDWGRIVAFRATGQTGDYNNVSSFGLEAGASGTPTFRFEAAGATWLTSAITYDRPYRVGTIVDAAQDVTTYVNNSGTLNASALAWDFGGASSSGTLQTGMTIGGGNEQYDGYICEIVLCSSALSTLERLMLDNYFVAKWSLPNTFKLLLHMDGADASTTFTDSSASAHTVTVQGNAQVDTAQSKFGGASALFDGTGDSLSLDGSSDFSFGIGDFTISMWYRYTSFGQKFFDMETSSLNGPQLYQNGTELKLWVNGADRINGQGLAATNTWYHVAYTRSGSNNKLFINGSQIGSTWVNQDNIVAGGVDPIIGSTTIGWIDEIAVEKGYARWTSNFTAPTAPW